MALDKMPLTPHGSKAQTNDSQYKADAKAPIVFSFFEGNLHGLFKAFEVEEIREKSGNSFPFNLSTNMHMKPYYYGKM